jgi:adenylyltransferase/sulfurtransferase
MANSFSEDDLQRYARQMILSQVGGGGQTKIRAARVLLIGLGGLGSPVALYLAAAGVGSLGLLDNDPVDLSNLHRQIIHFSTDIGRPKVLSAKAKIRNLNPTVAIKAYRERLTAENALEIFSNYDLVVDGSDNFATRYLVNDACVLKGIPLVSGAVLQFQGQVTTILPKKSHCYRCLFPEPPAAESIQSCADAGVMGSVAGVVGALQATEALKWILGLPDLLTDRMLSIDLMKMTFRDVPVKRNPNCSVCGDHPSIVNLSGFGEIYSRQIQPPNVSKP